MVLCANNFNGSFIYKTVTRFNCPCYICIKFIRWKGRVVLNIFILTCSLVISWMTEIINKTLKMSLKWSRLFFFFFSIYLSFSYTGDIFNIGNNLKWRFFFLLFSLFHVICRKKSLSWYSKMSLKLTRFFFKPFIIILYWWYF